MQGIYGIQKLEGHVDGPRVSELPSAKYIAGQYG